MGKVEREDDRSHLATEPEMSLPKIAVTMGDPAGIGPEVCLHLLQNKEIAEQCVPIIFGDKVVLEQSADQCNLPEPEKYIGGLAETDGPCVLDIGAIGLEDFETGKVNAATEAFTRAVALKPEDGSDDAGAQLAGRGDGVVAVEQTFG